jgi:hypothetical protein
MPQAHPRVLVQHPGGVLTLGPVLHHPGKRASLTMCCMCVWGGGGGVGVGWVKHSQLHRSASLCGTVAFALDMCGVVLHVFGVQQCSDAGTQSG